MDKTAKEMGSIGLGSELRISKGTEARKDTAEIRKDRYTKQSWTFIIQLLSTSKRIGLSYIKPNAVMAVCEHLTKLQAGHLLVMKNKQLLCDDVPQMVFTSNRHRSLVNVSEMPTRLGGVVPVMGVLGKQCHRQESSSHQGVARLRRKNPSHAGGQQALPT